MPIEKWSDTIDVCHLADDPQFTEDVAALESRVMQKPVDAVLDFGALHFINSSNIARLLKLRKTMINQHRKMVLCAVPTQVWSSFLLTGLDKIFSFSDSVPTALATLSMKSSA